MLAKMWRKENPCTLLMRMSIGTVPVEHSMKMKASQTTKNGTTT